MADQIKSTAGPRPWLESATDRAARLLHEKGEAKSTIVDGLDALRWLLNISRPEDEPDSRVAALLDETRSTSGRTVREDRS